jgi:hypothetical protein
MGSVRNQADRAWVLLGPHVLPAQQVFTETSISAQARRPLEDSMQDLLYVGLTILAFGVLWIIVKGVERFER